jgi:hypothetical protein
MPKFQIALFQAISISCWTSRVGQELRDRQIWMNTRTNHGQRVHYRGNDQKRRRNLASIGRHFHLPGLIPSMITRKETDLCHVNLIKDKFSEIYVYDDRIGGVQKVLANVRTKLDAWEFRRRQRGPR